MSVSERVIVELEARLGRYETNIANAERKFDRAMSGIQRSASATEGLVSRAMSGITGALAGVSAIALARSFLDIADTAKKLEAQLRLATAGFGSFAKAQEDVRRIAADTRSGLEETASLYGNFARGAKELGASQDDAARATETFAKTLKISGADANQAASATLQFGQALAAGALRGDELNSVLEASPRLARLLTESMGKPIGEIKALGEAGELTADKLLNALTNQKFTAGIDAEFRELPVTFDDAMTQVENAAIITFGAFDRGGQFSTALANFITDGTNGFKDLEQSANDFGVAARANIEGLASAFAPVFAEAQRLFNYLNGGFNGVDIGRDIQKSLDQIDMITSKVYPTNFGGRFRAGKQAAAARLRGEQGERAVNALISPYLDRFGRPISRIAPARSSGPVNKDLEKGQRLVADLEKLKAKASGAELTRINARIAKQNKINGYLAQGVSAEAARAATGGGRGQSAEAAAKKAQREREKAIRDDASKVRESAQLQDDITAAKAALAVATRDILQFNIDQINSERDQRIAEYETQQKLGRLTAKELADRTAAVEQIADLQRQRVFQIADENEKRDDLAKAQAANQNEQDLLRAQEGLANSRAERRDIELRLVDLAYQQERADLEAVLASTTATQAQKDIAEARLRILGQLQAQDVEAANRNAEGPLARYRRELSGPDRARDQVETAVIDELEGVRDSISSAVQKTLGVKNPILAALINSFIEQQLIKPLLDGVAGAAGGGGGVIGGLVGAVRSTLGFAGGGSGTLGGRGGTDRNLLSLNGRPIANVSRGEVLNVGRKPLSGGSSGNTIINQSFNLDARYGITTPELLQHIEGVRQQALQTAGAVGQSVMRGVPSRLAQFQRDGT